MDMVMDMDWSLNNQLFCLDDPYPFLTTEWSDYHEASRRRDFSADFSISPHVVDGQGSKSQDHWVPSLSNIYLDIDSPPESCSDSSSSSSTPMGNESDQNNEIPPLSPGSEKSRLERRRVYRTRSVETETSSGKRVDVLKCERCRINKTKCAWPADYKPGDKCQNCSKKDLECSEPTVKSNTRGRAKHPWTKWTWDEDRQSEFRYRKTDSGKLEYQYRAEKPPTIPLNNPESAQSEPSKFTNQPPLPFAMEPSNCSAIIQSGVPHVEYGMFSTPLPPLPPFPGVGSASEGRRYENFLLDQPDHDRLGAVRSISLKPQSDPANKRQRDLEPSVPPNLNFRNTRQTKYSDVSVLLICWEWEKGSQIEAELEMLRDVFEQRFSFSTRKCYIPNKNSLLSLIGEVVAFLGEDDPEQLKIVYYGGHGELAKGHQSLWMSSVAEGIEGKHPSISWNAIQNMFETANSDILVLLGCRSFITRTPDDQRRGCTEYLMAYGFNYNPHTSSYFSRALITELNKLATRQTSFSVAELHALIFANVQDHMLDQATPLEPPMHIFLPGDSNSSSSIHLANIRSS